MKKLIVLIGILSVFTACQYEFIEEPTLPPVDTEVSFTNDIVPIFVTDNNCTACHTTGKTAPDLSAANAYQSLVSGGLVVSNDPEASLIYTFVQPDASTHRWKTYSTYEAGLIYAWINQGANDN